MRRRGAAVADGKHYAAAEPVVEAAAELFAAQQANTFEERRCPLGAAAAF